jgi:hypothetical protein
VVLPLEGVQPARPPVRRSLGEVGSLDEGDRTRAPSKIACCPRAVTRNGQENWKWNAGAKYKQLLTPAAIFGSEERSPARRPALSDTQRGE